VDVERALVSRALISQSFVGINERNIEPHHFLQRPSTDPITHNPVPYSGEVFEWMMEHQRRYNAVPSMELARVRFPNYEFVQTTDVIEVLLDEFVAAVGRREMIRATRAMAVAADDPSQWTSASDVLFEIASSVARSMPGSNVTKFSDSLNLLALYHERERTGETPGMSLAVPELDAITYGAQPRDLIIVQAFLNVGKSSYTIKTAADAYFKHGRTGLVHSLEMDGDKLAMRWAAIAADFSYRAAKRLQLTEEEKRRWHDVGERAANAKFEKDLYVIDDDRHPTVDKIYADIQKWQPDFCVVDTIDEVKAPAHVKEIWAQQGWVAAELKGVARSTNKIIFACAQAGRDAEKDGATLGNTANSIGIPRKADIVVGLHATPDMIKRHQTEFRLLKIRDDEGVGEKIIKYWNRGTMEIRDWLPTDSVATKPVTQGASA